MAFGAFTLAKQAGFDFGFQSDAQPLKPARLYLMPCVTGHWSMSRRRWHELLQAVRDGATLYISYQDGFLSQFEAVTGLRVESRERRSEPMKIRFAGHGDDLVVFEQRPVRMNLESRGAEVLATEEDGNPAMAVSHYGKGRVIFLAAPLELEAVKKPRGFATPLVDPAVWVYRQVAKRAKLSRVIGKTDTRVGVTEHSVTAKSRIAVLINYFPEALELPITLSRGWTVDKALYGEKPAKEDAGWRCRIKANDALVFRVTHGRSG